MKVTFDFDGEHLTLKLAVETKHERAVAELIEAYSVASVSVNRERDYGYGDPKAKSVTVLLRKPEGYTDE